MDNCLDLDSKQIFQVIQHLFIYSIILFLKEFNLVF